MSLKGDVEAIYVLFFSVVLGTSLVWLDLRKPRLCLYLTDSQAIMAVLSVLIQGEGERVDGCSLTFSFSKPWATILCQPLVMSPEINLTRCLPS